MSRAWQWKIDLESGARTKFDLYDELGKAPGEIAYFPSPTQMAAHRSEVSTKQVAGGWRVGKSTWLAAELLPYMFRDKAVIWIVANDYVLARYEFKYIRAWLQWLNVPFMSDSMPNMGPWRLVTGWGAELKTQTAADITKIEGGDLDAAGVAESGLMDPDIINRLRGRVTEKRGPILMSGSLDASEPWYMETFEKYIRGPVDGRSWQSWGVPSWENKIVFPGGREDPAILELESTLNEDEFKLKVACQIARPQELVFPEFDKRLQVVPMEFTDIDPTGRKLEYPEFISNDFGMTVNKIILPKRDRVHLTIDPGGGNPQGAYAVLAIRKYDDIIFIIDEVYMKMTTVEEVLAECKTREWWPDVDFAVMDIAGKQKPAMASHAEIWARPENLGFFPAMQYIHIEDGIGHLKSWIRSPMNKKPRLWVSPDCHGLIREFALYRYRTIKENRPISEAPIDANNHSIKALIYYLVNRFAFGGKSVKTTSAKYVRDQTGQSLTDGSMIIDPNQKRYISIKHWALSDD